MINAKEAKLQTEENLKTIVDVEVKRLLSEAEESIKASTRIGKNCATFPIEHYNEQSIIKVKEQLKELGFSPSPSPRLLHLTIYW